MREARSRDLTAAAWLLRIRDLPEVELLRGDQRTAYRASAVSDDAVRDSVNRAMAEKYGHVNRVLVLLRDHSNSVPIRLDPRPSQRTVPHREHADGAFP